MAHKTKVSGTEYTITKGKTRVSGTDYSISGGKTRVGGTHYTLPLGSTGGGSTIGDLSVGSILNFNVGTNSRQFLIVHKGLPSDIYDASCDGVWLMGVNGAAACRWTSNTSEGAKNSYRLSITHGYLPTTWAGTLETRVKDSMITAKIPYYCGRDQKLYTGSEGLGAKVFAPSLLELGVAVDGIAPIDGATLDYFKDGSDSTRILKTSSGGALTYWTRTPVLDTTDEIWYIDTDGAATITETTSSDSRQMRPTFILPYDFEI